jgi:predicted RNA-binding Zn-ribbon protein involved in translation (DUF1610 family)
MTNPVGAEAKVDLVALRCARCGGDVPAADAETVPCPHCGQATVVPEAHRRAVALVREQDEELRRADAEWARYAKKTWPRWLASLLAAPPSLVLGGGLTAALLVKLGVLALPLSPRELLAWLGLVPLTPLVALAVLAYWSSLRAKGTALARVALAARPGKVPSCRACGAPLTVPESALFVRCVYCRTDSLVTLDALEARALVENIERAEASATRALESAQGRRNKARQGMKWLSLVWLGMIALALLWAAVPALDALLALVMADMLVLSMLTYMLAFGTLVEGLERSGGRPTRYNGAIALIVFALAVGSMLVPWMIAG